MSVDDRRLAETNWRPTRTATAASALLAVSGTLLLASLADAALPAALGLVAGGCLAGAVWTTAVAERRVATLAIGALATVGGLGLLAAAVAAALGQLGWSPSPPLPPLSFAPFAFALAGAVTGFGALGALWGVAPGDDAGTAAGRLFVAALLPMAVLVLDRWDPPTETVREWAGVVADLALSRTPAAVEAGMPVPRTGGFLLLVAIAVVAVRTALGSLPLAELADETSRDDVASAVGRSRSVLASLAGVCTALSVVPVALGPGAYEGLSPGMHGALFAVTTSTGLRWLLVVVALGGVCAAVVPRLVRAAASERFRPDRVPVASLGAGAVLVAAVVAAHGRLASVALDRAGEGAGRALLRPLLESVGSFALVLGIVTFGLLLATLVLLGVRTLGGLRLLDETAGVQLASAGVLCAAVAAAVADLHVALVVGGVAASLLAWDLGEFAATLGGEIGRAGTTRRGEFVHAAGGGLLAAVAGLVALGVDRAVEWVPAVPTPLAVVVVAAAVVGTVLLFVVSR